MKHFIVFLKYIKQKKTTYKSRIGFEINNSQLTLLKLTQITTTLFFGILFQVILSLFLLLFLRLLCIVQKRFLQVDKTLFLHRKLQMVHFEVFLIALHSLKSFYYLFLFEYKNLLNVKHRSFKKWHILLF